MTGSAPGSRSAARRIEELETLLRAGELLDATLGPDRLLDLALDLALRVVRADAVLIAVREPRDVRVRLLKRGDPPPRETGELASRLARRVLETGEPGVGRDASGPGGRAAAALLGTAPAVRIAVPLTRAGVPFGVLEVFYREDPAHALADEERSLRAVADHLAISLDHARLLAEQERRVREFSHLVDIAAKISAHLDLDAVLAAIVDSVGDLIEADAAGIFLIDRDTREIRKECLRGYDPDRVDDARLKIGRGILGWVASSGQGINVPDVREDSRYVAARDSTRSEMATPLTYEGRVIGVFNLESDRPSAFDAHDLALLDTFASHAAISIMNAYLHGEAQEKRRLEEQLEVARRIQRMLLPRDLPELPGHVLAGENLPSSAVGGDWFDFVPRDDGRWAVVIADVSGNGIPAGLIMAGFRAELRAALRRTDDPREAFAEVNRILCGELDPDYFVTAFLGIYDPRSGSLRYASAGHEPALLVRSGGGFERLMEGGLLLGVFCEATYDQAMVHLAPGDRLLLYTDGLSDAIDPWGGPLGEDGVLRLLAEADEAALDPADVPGWMLRRAEDEAAELPEEADDRTLVVLRRELRAPDPSGSAGF
jgi:sigma-B regulation protein RsbU (phosphoserine phosphatase)